MELGPRRVERRSFQHLGLWSELDARYSAELFEIGRAGKIRATHHVAIPPEQLWRFNDLMTIQREARFGRSRGAYARATTRFKKFLHQFDAASYRPAIGTSNIIPISVANEVFAE